MVPFVPGPGTMPGFGAPATACVAPTYATAGSVAPPAKYTGPDPALRFTCRRGSFLPATGGVPRPGAGARPYGSRVRDRRGDQAPSRNQRHDDCGRAAERTLH